MNDTNRTMFWLCLWLAVALAVCKSVLLGLPAGWSFDDVVGWSRDLGIMSHADVLFAIAACAVGQTTLAVNRDRPRVRRGVGFGATALAVLCLVYGIVSVQVFAYLRTPLTYPLIYVAGDMKNMRSSLGAFVTPTMLAALLLGPVAYLLLVSCSLRLIRLQSTRPVRIARRAGLVIVFVFVAWGHYAYSNRPWNDRVDWRVAENPHWVLVKSFLTDFTSDGERVQLVQEFPSEFLSDFHGKEDDDESKETTNEEEGEGRKYLVVANSEPDIDSALEDSSSPLIRRGTQAFPSRWLENRPKNVIVYVLESVGSQFLSLYGSPYSTTPRLEAEAANSLVFDNFYAHCGVTANSLVAINLGIYPGLTWREYTVEQPNLPGTTLAQRLKERGYRTAYMTSGEIQYVNMDGFLANRGYDLVCGYEYLGCPAMLDSWGVEDRCLVDSMLRWVDADRERPFFAMVWTQQTHHPYEPSPGVPFIDYFKGVPKDKLPPDDYDLGRYLNTIHEADRQLGRLFDELRRRGLADDTLVVVTGDHGEGFGQPHDIYGHGSRVFDEVVKVPLVLWNPRLFGRDAGGGRRLDTIGGHIDLNPTLAELLELPPAGSWQGRSLFDPTRPPRVYFFAANDDYLLGVRERDWKYIYNAAIGRDQLFQLADDPHEQTNRAGDEVDRCAELRQRLAAWMKYEQDHIARLRRPPAPDPHRASLW